MVDTGDLLMKFVANKTGPIAGGSMTELTTPSRIANPLAKGFQPGFMLEIESLSFKCGTSGEEPGSRLPGSPAKPPPPKTGSPRGPTSQEEASTDKARHKAAAVDTSRGGYQSWRAGKSTKYPLDIQPVSFTRTIDEASAVLMQNCIDCVSYDSATIIKRKPAGGDLAGEVYLRMDFIGVLVIKVDWSHDDNIKETCSFISRSITVSYRPQLRSGSLGPIISGFWSMVPGERQQTFT